MYRGNLHICLTHCFIHFVSGTSSDSRNVFVTVLDVNEHAPEFSSSGSYSSAVDENVASGTAVITVYAFDADTRSGSSASQVRLCVCVCACVVA